MGVSIVMLTGKKKWKDITPPWRSDMVEMLREIARNHDTYLLAFGPEHLDALRYRRKKQRVGEASAPFDRSEEWAECFQRIIDRIESHGAAVIELQY